MLYCADDEWFIEIITLKGKPLVSGDIGNTRHCFNLVLEVRNSKIKEWISTLLIGK